MLSMWQAFPGTGPSAAASERRYLMTAEVAGTTYASVNLLPQSPAHECNTPAPGMQMPLPGTRDAAPRLQFPAGTSIARTGGGGGGGSSNGYVQTSVSRIVSAETQGRLVAYLAEQIAAQGWQQESQWSGSRAAGSSWRKTGGDAPSQGRLEIVRVSEGPTTWISRRY